ncbi:GlsB/YeaQ/YmgE family stress response membrane protein [Hyalangium gracile]|uniref:GlsB/YeaQ/YmgE family stress response membrane protein n=1 Tax=Hyalangium gracile TaxID=394092 RepID=UPI001CCB2D43|nr:GlsB/YeaQ/YmgE family stress response membrane protein [Hyalangium gracile]
MMSLCSWVVFGFIVGLIARFVMPGQQNMGFIRTTLLGVGGSFVGGVMSALIWGGNWKSPSPSSWIGSIVGAIVLLLISQALSSKR